MHDFGLVSVIIPTYNRADYLIECVEAIRNQTYKNLEIIIISDGGTDSSEKDLAALGDSRILWYNLGYNYGRPAPARNYGLKLVKGEFICFCDDDDIWLEDKVEIQLRSLTASFDLTFSGFNVIGSSPSFISTLKMVIIYNYLRISGGRAYNLLAILNPVCNSSVMIRSSAINSFSFNEKEELRAVEDYVGWIGLFKHLKVSYSVLPLVQYRIHDLNISNNSKNSLRVLIEFVKSNKVDFPRVWRVCFIQLNRIRVALA